METKGYVDSLVKKFYGKSYDEEHEVIQSIMNKLIREDMGGDTGIHIKNTICEDLVSDTGNGSQIPNPFFI